MKQKTSLILGFLTTASLALWSFSQQNYTQNEPSEPLLQGQHELELNEGGVTFSADLDNKYYLRDGAGVHYLYIKVKGGEEQDRRRKRAPLNISLVVDRSGSMSGAKISNVREALSSIIDQLGPRDIVSLVQYDDQVDVLSRSAKVQNKMRLKSMVHEIYPGGSTNLWGGTAEGYHQVSMGQSESYINRVMLMTDGLANVGISSNSGIKTEVQKKYRSTGIGVTTFGIGADYNEDLLTAMAETGGGNYYFIERPNQIAGILSKELTGMLSAVARNAQLVISLPAGVKCEEVYNYTFESNHQKIYINLNDIYANEEKAIVLRLKSQPRLGRKFEVTTTLSFTDVKDNRTVRSSITNEMTPTNNYRLCADNENKDVMNMAILYRGNKAFEAAMKDVDKGDYRAAKSKSQKVIKELKARQAVAPSPVLKKQEEQMIKYVEDMEDVKSMSQGERSIYQKANKAGNYNIRKMK